MPPRFQSYRQWAEEVAPQLHAALSGEREISPQLPRTEAWLALCLFFGDSPLPLRDVIQMADGIEHAVPNPEEIAWGFLRLRTRGWLVEQEDRYGLTREGRRVIESVVGEGTVLDRMERLEVWTLAHPPPSDE
ncbi:MAG: hypothetical protein A3K59_09575 [Euryarchaeota archaeon RBG_19FT_COMBO_69_17]|nr:MAG: hypothetical protein A3K59_09575 [Euryarchaeota archaeon RBG_19FT_COMBO_69_17]